jgi:SAM-dependent methyltransferase
MQERFRPIAHRPPTGIINTILFYCRLLVDFQFLTVYRHIKKELPKFKGKILDVGCGNSPFRFLVDSYKAQYVGIDISDADYFDYNNVNKIIFDGEHIPFENESFDNIISTEVLEHVENPEMIIDEMYRVLKPSGNAFVTVPWSARVHYAPYDFCRYTPFKLEKLFSKFQHFEILNRGTDINSIVAKIVVVFMGLTGGGGKLSIGNLFKLLLFGLLFPLLFLSIIIGHLELLIKFGDGNDPLGYTIILCK